jgi:hypothetical protein
LPRSSSSRRAGKQRSYPKELLLCVARASDGEEEAAKDPSAFRAEGWIERSAGARALASIVDEDFPRVADVSALPFDPPAAMTVTGSAPPRLSISDARWLSQFVPVAKAILKGDARAFVKEVLDAVTSDPKPTLKLIDNGGPSRA